MTTSEAGRHALAIESGGTHVGRRIVVVFSDIHCGHRSGLCPPGIKLPTIEDDPSDWWSPTLTHTQEWLWSCYEADRKGVKELAAGDPITVIVNGDITWGKRYPEDLISGRDYDQCAIAASCLMRWLTMVNVDKLRLITGTPSHEFGLGSAPYTVAAMLGAAMDCDIEVSRHPLFSVDGVPIDCAHHGPTTGMRIWTQGNQMRYYLKSMMLAEIVRWQAPPRVVVRSHYHTYARETVRINGAERWVSDLVVTPAYCGMTHYVTQVTQSAYMQSAGMVALEIVDGELVKIHDQFTRAHDLRTREEL